MTEAHQIGQEPQSSPMPGHAMIDPPVVTSRELLAGGRELIIHHGDATYRLKLTGSNKLILTK